MFSLKKKAIFSDIVIHYKMWRKIPTQPSDLTEKMVL